MKIAALLTIIRGGTTGPWLAPWELPNTITCNDRPPVVPPSPPSAW